MLLGAGIVVTLLPHAVTILLGVCSGAVGNVLLALWGTILVQVLGR